MTSLKEYGTIILVGFIFGLFPAWWLWTATILKALIREHKKVPQAVIATMWPNRYKQRGVGHSAVNSTINGFQAGQYVLAGVVLLVFALGVISDFRNGFPVLRDFAIPIPFLVIWLLPSYLLKKQINKMEPATAEWVDEWRF